MGILLDAAGNFLAFGQPATNSYITMGGSKTGWMLFERFKMALYDSKPKVNDDENSDGKLRDMLTAINGKEHPADKVFIEALKYIKSQVFKFFTKNKLQIENIDDIQWILTVPAIWSEKAKYKMEQWAQRAGLTNKEIPNHLKIVYEPDCASLSIQYEIQKLKAKKDKKLSIMKASKKVKDVPIDDDDNNEKEEKTQEIQIEDKNEDDNVAADDKEEPEIEKSQNMDNNEDEKVVDDENKTMKRRNHKMTMMKNKILKKTKKQRTMIKAM